MSFSICCFARYVNSKSEYLEVLLSVSFHLYSLLISLKKDFTMRMRQYNENGPKDGIDSPKVVKMCTENINFKDLNLSRKIERYLQKFKY